MRMVRASAHGKFEGGVLSKAEWQGVMRSTLHGSIYEQQRSGADVIAFGELDQAIIDAQKGGRPGPEQLLGASAAAQGEPERARGLAHETRRPPRNPTAAAKAQAAAAGQKAEFWV